MCVVLETYLQESEAQEVCQGEIKVTHTLLM